MRFLLLFYFFIVACASRPNANNESNVMSNPNEHDPKNLKKPGSSYRDTLFIKEAAVVFYNPDSLQLIKIKEINIPMVYKSMVHEYYYQQKTAKTDLIHIWPKLKTYDITNYRFLVFLFKNNKDSIIDLDNINDISGIIIFNRVRPPEIVDMMNFVNDATYYFDK